MQSSLTSIRVVSSSSFEQLEKFHVCFPTSFVGGGGGGTNVRGWGRGGGATTLFILYVGAMAGNGRQEAEEQAWKNEKTKKTKSNQSFAWSSS